MRKTFAATLLALFLVGCGHNILTNYRVKGLDVTFPIFGYPFGFRLGEVTANSNFIRGNATYTSHSNTGTEVTSGASQTTDVIQFSSNIQVNEGNIEKIIESKDVSPEVKSKFIEDYLAKSSAPTLLPASTNTSSTTTASATDPEIHKNSISKSSSNSFGWLSLIKKVIKIGINFFLMTAVGKTIAIILFILAIYIAIKLLYTLLKKVVLYCATK